MMARIYGIDISHNQGSFNLEVNRNNIQFAVIRASNGTTEDRRFKIFAEAIAEVPIRGAYHYFRSFKSPAVQDQNRTFPWKKQADKFLELVGGIDFHFFALDFERSFFHVDWATEKKHDNTLNTEFAEDAQKWMSYVDENTDIPLVIYTNQPLYQQWLKPIGGMKKWPLWIAQYHAHPNPDSGKPDLPEGVEDWKIWQYSADGNNKGAEYGVGSQHIDLNVYHGTLEEMRQWLKIDIEEEPEEPVDVPEPTPEEPKEAGDIDDGSDPVITWGDVRAAARTVAKRRGLRASTWFREAGIRDEMKDKSLRPKPYDGKPIEEWAVSPSEDRDQIRKEIVEQLGLEEGGGGGNDDPEFTWGELRSAARTVAKRHELRASAWFREANIRDEMKDQSLRPKPYRGKTIDDWQVPIILRLEIRKELDKMQGSDIEVKKTKVITVQPEGDLIKLDIPYVSQYSPSANSHTADCGPTCLAMIINANPVKGEQRTVNELYKLYLKKKGPQDYTNWTDMIKICRSERLGSERKTNGSKAEALKDLQTLIRGNRPFVVLVKYRFWKEAARINRFGGSHFVLVTGFDEKHVYIHDPLFISRKSSPGKFFQLPIDTFLDGWGGFSGENPNFSRLATDKVVSRLSG
jgi:GH25 family lysozyme M1 (1,4-beta-N-acetylmuramidase)